MPRAQPRPDLARTSRPRNRHHAAPANPSPLGRPSAPEPSRALRLGGVHRCRRPGFAVVLRRRGQAGCRPLGAAARFNAIIAAGRSAASRAARAIYRSSGRGGAGTATGSITAGNTTAGNIPGSGRSRRGHRADSTPQRRPRIKHNCCKRSRAISRRWSGTSNSSRRTSSKWPATIQKPLAELKASQEEMKRALAKVSEQTPPKASAASGAAGSGLAQARADVSAAAREGAASILPEGVDLRRLVAADGDHRHLVLQQRFDATPWGCAMSSFVATRRSGCGCKDLGHH